LLSDRSPVTRRDFDSAVAFFRRALAKEGFDFLQRWEETDADLGFVDSAEQTAIVRLSGYLEKAEDGTAFRPDYDEQVAAARSRLRERYGGWLPRTGTEAD
jgi:hypothetical protein